MGGVKQISLDLTVEVNISVRSRHKFQDHFQWKLCAHCVLSCLNPCFVHGAVQTLERPASEAECLPLTPRMPLGTSASSAGRVGGRFSQHAEWEAALSWPKPPFVSVPGWGLASGRTLPRHFLTSLPPSGGMNRERLVGGGRAGRGGGGWELRFNIFFLQKQTFMMTAIVRKKRRDQKYDGASCNVDTPLVMKRKKKQKTCFPKHCPFYVGPTAFFIVFFFTFSGCGGSSCLCQNMLRADVWECSVSLRCCDWATTLKHSVHVAFLWLSSSPLKIGKISQPRNANLSLIWGQWGLLRERVGALVFRQFMPRMKKRKKEKRQNHFVYILL